jgi:hypothetical protein
MLSLLERLLSDDTPDEQVDLEARQSDANDALQDRVNADTYGIDECGQSVRHRMSSKAWLTTNSIRVFECGWMASNKLSLLEVRRWYRQYLRAC